MKRTPWIPGSRLRRMILPLALIVGVTLAETAGSNTTPDLRGTTPIELADIPLLQKVIDLDARFNPGDRIVVVPACSGSEPGQ